jgi:hypothetical protein
VAEPKILKTGDEPAVSQAIRRGPRRQHGAGYPIVRATPGAETHTVLRNFALRNFALRNFALRKFALRKFALRKFALRDRPVALIASDQRSDAERDDRYLATIL